MNVNGYAKILCQYFYARPLFVPSDCVAPFNFNNVADEKIVNVANEKLAYLIFDFANR